MSQYVDNLIKDIKENTDSWRPCEGHLGDSGIKKTINGKQVKISNCSHVWLWTSVLVEVDGMRIMTEFPDGFNLEAAVRHYYRNASVTALTNS